jgi:hypothetical protein
VGEGRVVDGLRRLSRWHDVRRRHEAGIALRRDDGDDGGYGGDQLGSVEAGGAGGEAASFG